MDYSQAMKLFKTNSFLYAIPLFEGKLEDCLSFDIKINSSIPALLGLPPLQHNQIEGIVVKSNTFCNLSGKNARAIWKMKNAKFEEVNPPAERTKYEIDRDEKLEAEATAYQELDRYVNENRLISLQSKIGPVKLENLNEAATLMSADAIKDFVKDFEQLWSKVETAKQEQIQKNTSSKVRSFIFEYLNNNK